MSARARLWEWWKCERESLPAPQLLFSPLSAPSSYILPCNCVRMVGVSDLRTIILCYNITFTEKNVGEKNMIDYHKLGTIIKKEKRVFDSTELISKLTDTLFCHLVSSVTSCISLNC